MVAPAHEVLTAADLKFEPPHFPLAELAAAARDLYDLDGELRPLNGERDQNHCLESESGERFVLKVSGAAEDPAVVDFQVQALRHLEQQVPDMPLPRVIRTQEGADLGHIVARDGTRHIVRLLSWLDGVLLDEGTPPRTGALQNIAAFQARLCLGLRGFFHPAANHWLPWDISKALLLNPGLHAHAGDDALALTDGFRERAGTKVLPQLKALRHQVIHGDAHNDNVLYAHPGSDEVSGLIDFGDMCFAPLVQDLAVVAASFARVSADPVGGAVAQVAAFHALLPLEDREFELLHDLMCMRLVTALLLYDFRIHATEQPAAFLAEERPKLLQVTQQFLALDAAEMAEQYRNASGIATTKSSAGEVADAALIARRNRFMGPSYQLFYEQPVQLVRGQGTWMFAADGRRLLDCYNNVASVGHAHPHVVAAITRQVATLNTHTRYLQRKVIDYAERLAGTMPGELSVCLFVCSGTEANDLALRIARTVTGKNGAIVMESAYHGNSNAVMALTTADYPADERPDWLLAVEPPNLYRGPYRAGDEDAGDKYAALLDPAIDELGRRKEGLAALFIDTIFDSNGTLLAPQNYFEKCYARVRAAGGLCVADEVQAGFGRLGDHLWGFADYGVTPDIVTLGKPMGAGHPVAAVVTTPAIARAFAARFSYFNTFGGNPVSAAAASAVLDVIENENILQNVREVGAYLRAGLARLKTRYPVIGDVRGKGLIYGLELVADAETQRPLEAEARRMRDLMLGEGVLIGSTGRFENVVKIRPPMVFSKENADTLLHALERSFAKLR
ncbi:MAG TPA: aminotransferase class III-fold pyridoxal phosphate-dependent enzyme [Woeseiaceae bacterium]|nr:aminotransferase class III-fold pyridoxal phosphate-dependent enzyme [Woeseiaceae bacterium]